MSVGDKSKPDFSNVTGGASSTAPPPAAPKAAEPRSYTVVSGDNLSKIAKKYYGDANQWKKIFEANKDSINLYAECMCKRIGAAVTGQSGSWQNGTAALTDFLRNSVGLSETEFTIDDGCGLSRKNGVSANVLCKVLAHDWYGPNRDAFVSSLAVGGVDRKTLKKRFTDVLRRSNGDFNELFAELKSAASW